MVSGSARRVAIAIFEEVSAGFSPERPLDLTAHRLSRTDLQKDMFPNAHLIVELQSETMSGQVSNYDLKGMTVSSRENCINVDVDSRGPVRWDTSIHDLYSWRGGRSPSRLSPFRRPSDCRSGSRRSPLLRSPCRRSLCRPFSRSPLPSAITRTPDGLRVV